ncbi:hypothetical protein MWN34_08715 [Ancylobacter sp. 6x-1]|uniref:Transposase n=1 Tax=Ancylobacter crimeensis TaxID=2579147 RepID=A0ABT0DAL5_9HYPH|nr:hypothetical protein [Ancylobacter crimeensis]MCK0196995.1 hypothetical protein [Ancylobacter crimeensis]
MSDTRNAEARQPEGYAPGHRRAGGLRHTPEERLMLALNIKKHPGLLALFPTESHYSYNKQHLHCKYLHIRFVVKDVYRPKRTRS